MSPGAKSAIGFAGLVGVVLLALLLRCHHLGGTRDDPDEVMLPVYVLDSLPRAGLGQSLLTFQHAGVGNPGRLLAYPLSATLPVLVFAWAHVADLCGLPLDETAWVLPMALLGALTPLVAFALVRRIESVAAAWLAALLIAVAPLHVLVSRSLAAAWVPAFLLEMLGLLALARARRGGLGARLVLSAVVATYVLTHNQFPAYAPVLLYATMALDDAGPMRARFGPAVRFLLRPSVVALPVLAIVGLGAMHLYFGVLHPPGYRSTGPAGVGILGHMLRRGSDPGYYGGWVAIEALHALGPAFLALGVAALLLWLGGIGRGALSGIPLSGIMVVWSVAYLAPFVFLVTPQKTLIRGYLGDGLYPLLLLAAVVSARLIAAGGAGRIAALGALVAALPLAGASAVFTVLQAGGPLALPRFHGVMQEDTGLKAAGYWVREHTPLGARVYGVALDPRVVRYYTRRESLGQIRLGPRGAESDCFRQFADEVDVVVVSGASGASLTATDLAPFVLAATVARADGRVALTILSRTAPSRAEVLRLADGNAGFDREYARLHRLGPLPDYRSCRDFRELW